MVEIQMRRRGIKDQAVLASMRTVPRHMFVPPTLRDEAYEDYPLPIGKGQTISQPYIVAYMAAAANLKKTDKVLEIGTGCGYSAAVLSNIVSEGQVYSVENIDLLAYNAQVRLSELGYKNVHTMVGDGSIGWPEYQPYDAIIVTAAAPAIPKSLKAQLAVGGRMIIPVTDDGIGEDLVRLTRNEAGFVRETLTAVRFVPLIGQEGY